MLVPNLKVSPQGVPEVSQMPHSREDGGTTQKQPPSSASVPFERHLGAIKQNFLQPVSIYFETAFKTVYYYLQPQNESGFLS